MADRLIMIKADGSVSIHADDRAYKPLNWMTPPCTLTETPLDAETSTEDTAGGAALWIVENRKGEQLRITIETVYSDTCRMLGKDPGLEKDGVEKHLQELLADNITTLGEGFRLIRREYETGIGPVDILCRDADNAVVAVEIKRRGDIDGVEQLSRYVERLNKDEMLRPVRGVYAAQKIKPQARTLAADRGFECVILDYDDLRGITKDELRLF